MPSDYSIVLASSSPYRRDLLDRLGLPFVCKRPDVDETPHPNEAPAALAARLAHTKAEAVAAASGASALVIGSDQVASCDGAVFGKPGHRDRTCEQLRRASGREVEFHTAVAVAAAGSGRIETGADLTRVRFRLLTDAEIDRYVDREQPYDCAGGFKAEGLGITLFESIESRDPTALIGLPLILVAKCLRAFGYDLP